MKADCKDSRSRATEGINLTLFCEVPEAIAVECSRKGGREAHPVWMMKVVAERLIGIAAASRL
ncbi:MAG: hypothetical protein Q4G71_11190 [Pseudomonadota bacterium]|nr:hypothetical protein [Pseudomonadota bacterium]